jgi:hypothetical protein
MKTIQNLIETLKDIISEATQSRSDYENMRLIPIPVQNNERRTPMNNQNNQNHH